MAKKLKSPKKTVEIINENKKLKSFKKIKHKTAPNTPMPANTPTKNSKILTKVGVSIISTFFQRPFKPDLVLELIPPQQDIHR